jgi:hypothetical protein
VYKLSLINKYGKVNNQETERIIIIVLILFVKNDINVVYKLILLI